MSNYIYLQPLVFQSRVFGALIATAFNIHLIWQFLSKGREVKPHSEFNMQEQASRVPSLNLINTTSITRKPKVEF